MATKGATATTKKADPKAAHKPQQDNSQKGILDRVHAFVNLKFPPTISELTHIRGEKQIKDIERDQLLEMQEFFLDQMDYEDAVHYMQMAFQNLRRNRL